MRTISSASLRRLLEDDREYAVLDIREPGEYNLGHIPRAASLPRRDIEFRINYLIPVRGTPIILVGDGGRRELLAAATLEAGAYRDVEVLEGGFRGWEKTRYSTESGVNVPSKAFGERLHRESNVPEIVPAALRELMERGEPILIFDARTPEEYARFCIPGGMNVPGGDLILWAEELKKRSNAPIVVNCAGRTRGIVGAQTLRRLGLDNVFALRNGTMGWLLAGFDLEQKPVRMPLTPPPDSVAAAEKLAAQIAIEEQIPFVSAPELEDLLRARERKTLYAIDVRSGGEFLSGHIPAFISVPGGQAVQRADDYVAISTAAIVFASNRAARATMAAYWYRKMGLKNVFVLEGGIDAWTGSGRKLEVGEPRVDGIGLERARASVRCMGASLLAGKPGLLILDVSLSTQYAAAHLPSAMWLSRGWIEERIPALYPDRRQPILTTCPDGRHSALAGAALAATGYGDVGFLEGGTRKWIEERRPIETGLTKTLAEPRDVVLSASMSGDKRAMQRYLDWEVGLERKTERE